MIANVHPALHSSAAFRFRKRSVHHFRKLSNGNNEAFFLQRNVNSLEFRSNGVNGIRNSIRIVCFANESLEDKNGILKAASVVAVASTLSKIIGMLREMMLASTFGLGPVMVAFSYSSLLPTFFISLLGGVNGPLQTAITTVLSQCTKEERPTVMHRVSCLVFILFSLLSVVVCLLSPPIIDATAPGLVLSNGVARRIAISQLRVMSPCVLLSALMGVGFGELSARGVWALPSLCPALSSISIISALLFHRRNFFTSNDMAAGLSLSAAVTVGALAQFLAQWLAQHSSQSSAPPLNPDAGNLLLPSISWLHDPRVQQVLSLLLPAFLSLGVMQIATATDMAFASFLPAVAPALGYANLLAMAPIGVLSTALITPLLPLFASLTQPRDWPRFKLRLRQAMVTSFALSLAMCVVMVPLSQLLVRMILQRNSFHAQDTVLVASLLNGYVIGSPGYLLRDVVLRGLYALGDARTPFVVSALAVVLNAVLDWALALHLGLGAEGLLAATAICNTLSAVALLARLSYLLNGVEMELCVAPALSLLVAAIPSYFCTEKVYQLLTGEGFASLVNKWLSCGAGAGRISLDAVALAGAVCLGLGLFIAMSMLFRLPQQLAYQT